MKFLPTGDAVRREIESLLRDEVSKPARFAVAFWGRSAEYRLVGPCEIICDLQSGACNPDTIEVLRKRPGTVVLQRKGLHAKVVVTSGGALVSSANMSTNGLGVDDYVSAGNLEAGIRINPGTKEFAEIEDWFAVVWKEAVPISDDDVARAREIWNLKNQALDDFDESKFRNHMERALTSISASSLLKDSFAPRHRMRAVRPDLLEIAKAALPGQDDRQIGKIATYACHALLCRSGTELFYAANDSEPSGKVTEEWIHSRFAKVGPHTKTLVDAVLSALAKSVEVNFDVRRAALQVLNDPGWP